MPELTPRLGIKKPFGNESVSRQGMNENWDIVDSSVAKKADLDNHTGNANNPHSTTAAQVGAPTTAQFTAHTGNTSNPHNVTAAQVGAIPANKTNQLAYEIVRSGTNYTPVVYDSVAVATNNAVVSKIVDIGSAQYHDIGKLVTVDCTGINFLKYTATFKWDWLTGAAQSADVRVRLRDTATNKIYQCGTLYDQLVKDSVENVQLAGTISDVDVSDIPGVATFAVEFQVAIHFSYSGNYNFTSDLLEIYANRKRRIKWA